MIRYPKVERLICVAGPPAVGKTWLLDRREAGSMDDIARSLDLPAFASLPAFAAGWIRPGSPESYETALYHLDILRGWKFGGQHLNPAADPGFRPLKESVDLTVITLLADPAVLLRRIMERPVVRDKTRFLSRPRVAAGELYSHYRVRRLYREPGRLIALYREWIDAVTALSPTGHHFLGFVPGPQVVSFDDWVDSVLNVASPREDGVILSG